MESVVLLCGAFVAGLINAVVGGGSLITFPALLAAGHPAVQANVTNTVALVPGLAGPSLGYRRELSSQGRRLAGLSASTLSGALVGAVALLSMPESAFDFIVPVLILFGCALVAWQDKLGKFALAHALQSQRTNHISLPLHAAAFVLAVYGAYFGAAYGILMRPILAILLPDEIQRLNALRIALSLIINIVAVVCFGLFGPVAWGTAALLSIGLLSGGYLGVGIARHLGSQWLRMAAIPYGLLMATILLAR
jgi:uncharacterized membrane protein YfcA